ncbi:MAG: 1-deoxy-D-xylulose-5-phosphate synthase [Prevotellaceae bacterium]|jgi:1-deoxy-D-xylulose-5-phosphate synthase|nr:1-deoxy-D-xylulose-5-phosphate synthase [Prevotellaceae bacterium]
MQQSNYPLLEAIGSPQDLKQLRPEQLLEVCREVRDFIIEAVSENPGHFGASLGVVELTVALHYAYSAPYDKLVWDVGHQAYAHKLLTGRLRQFASNRHYGGISGFPRMAESEYDAFGTGHSSTSISAALGMAVAAKLQGEDRHVVAIIGDGAMAGGMAFEGMNNAGIEQANLLVVLNDNNIAIDPSVGALSEYLTRITASRVYNRVKEKVWQKTQRFKPIRLFFQNTGIAIKSSILRQSNLFEALGFRYFGPVDGHDVGKLVKTLEMLRRIPGPKLLHVLTVKGKGYAPAEEDQTLWHAPGLFDRSTGLRRPAAEQAPTYQHVFGATLVELAERNPSIVGITPAMPTGSSLNLMMEQMPDRAFDVGIAEQHAVTFAAGLAAAGKIPFCCVYSTFMQRGYDSIIHDVALQNLHVVICLDRAGLTGEDGATHHGAYDVAYLRCIPNVVVAAPMDGAELRRMMYTAQLPAQRTFAIRYPRGSCLSPAWRQPFAEVEVGKARRLRSGGDIALLSLGHVGHAAAEAARRLALEGIEALHLDMRFAKPLDEEALAEVGRTHTCVITVEDGAIAGGLGSAAAEFFAERGYPVQLVRLGIPDRFVGHGTVAQLQAECGFDAEGVYRAAKRLLAGRG